MADYEALKAKVQELAERDWDVPALEARVRELAAKGIPKKKLDPQDLKANKEQILDSPCQRRAEEYNFILEELRPGHGTGPAWRNFGLGSMADHQGP